MLRASLLPTAPHSAWVLGCPSTCSQFVPQLQPAVAAELLAQWAELHACLTLGAESHAALTAD